MEEAADAIERNDVVIVVGETGSGKTTLLPKLLLKRGLRPICVTQPRRVAAMAAARRVSQELNCSLGAEVGFAVRFEHNFSESTKLKYVTDGVLLREAIQAPDLPHYKLIILDEVRHS